MVGRTWPKAEWPPSSRGWRAEVDLRGWRLPIVTGSSSGSRPTSIWLLPVFALRRIVETQLQPRFGGTRMNSVVELATYPGLDERVIVLRAGEVVDAVFVRTERFNLLVDTLDAPETCRAALDLLGQRVHDRPLVVVNSHMDWDHFWGNAAIAERAVIIAHEKALERLHDGSTEEVLRRKSAEDARFRGISLCPPTLTFTDHLVLHGGDLTVELIPTPGHTPDHVSAWIPELRTCLAVDAVEKPIPKVWSDDPNDLRLLVTSLRLIQDLGAEHVVLAHGHTAAPSVASQNIRYFETLAERVTQLGWTEGGRDEQVTPQALSLSDVTPLSDNMSPESWSFYERCHWTNLRATVRAFAQDDR